VHTLAKLGRWVALTVSFVPSAENPKMALNTPRDPTTEHTMIIVLSIAMFHQIRERGGRGATASYSVYTSLCILI
jgi:hypothetical protein